MRGSAHIRKLVLPLIYLPAFDAQKPSNWLLSAARTAPHFPVNGEKNESLYGSSSTSQ